MVTECRNQFIIFNFDDSLLDRTKFSYPRTFGSSYGRLWVPLWEMKYLSKDLHFSKYLVDRDSLLNILQEHKLVLGSKVFKMWKWIENKLFLSMW